MAAPAVGSMYRIIPKGTDGKSIFENVLYFTVTATAGTGATDLNVANTAAAEFVAWYCPLFAPAVSLYAVDVQRLNNVGVALLDIVTGVAGLPAVGTSAGDELPSYVAGCISLRSGLAGRSRRGRIFTWPPGESDNAAGGIPTAGWLTKADAFASIMQSPFVAGGGGNTTSFQYVIFSKKLLLQYSALTYVSRTVWADLRRRKIGVGQ